MKKNIVILLCAVLLLCTVCACAPEEPVGEQEEIIAVYSFSETEFLTLTQMDRFSKDEVILQEKKIGVGNFTEKLEQAVASLEVTDDVVGSVSEPTTAYLLSLNGKLYRFDKSFSTAALVTTRDGMGVALKMTEKCRQLLNQALRYAPDNVYECTVANKQGSIVNVFSAESTVTVLKADLKMTEGKNKLSVLYSSTVAQDAYAEVTSYQSDDSLSDNYMLDPVELDVGEQTVTFPFKGFDDINSYGYYLKIVLTAADRRKTVLTLWIEP